MVTADHRAVLHGCQRRQPADTRLQLGAKALGVNADIVEVQAVDEAVFEGGRINVIDPKLLPEDSPWGRESAEGGNAAYHYIRIACELGVTPRPSRSSRPTASTPAARSRRTRRSSLPAVETMT